MANFFDVNNRAHLSTLAMNSGNTVRVGLWGGDENGNDLVMYTYDSSVVDWSEEARPDEANTRYFQLRSYRAGFVTLSALHPQTGSAWDSIDVTVGTSTAVGCECICQDMNGNWNSYGRQASARDCRAYCKKMLGLGFADSKCR